MGLTFEAFNSRNHIIDWLKKYLKSSYHDGNEYLHYNGEITHYFKVKDFSKRHHHKTNRYLVYNNDILIANVGVYKFKQYCRTKFKQL